MKEKKQNACSNCLYIQLNNLSCVCRSVKQPVKDQKNLSIFQMCGGMLGKRTVNLDPELDIPKVTKFGNSSPLYAPNNY